MSAAPEAVRQFIAEGRALEREATEGPWLYDTRPLGTCTITVGRGTWDTDGILISGSGVARAWTYDVCEPGMGDAFPSDAAFIAECHAVLRSRFFSPTSLRSLVSSCLLTESLRSSYFATIRIRY